MSDNRGRVLKLLGEIHELQADAWERRRKHALEADSVAELLRLGVEDEIRAFRTAHNALVGLAPSLGKWEKVAPWDKPAG